MDPRYSGQDVVRCILCEDDVATMYCRICHIPLCEECVEQHLLNKSIVHDIMSLKEFLSALKYTKCPIHPTEQCNLHCERCDIPMCTQCQSSKNHKYHPFIDIMKSYKKKEKAIRTDLQELEKSIYPIYEKAASTIKVQKADQRKNYQEMTTALKQQGKVWHREINTIIQSLQSEIDVKDSQHRAIIEKHQEQIKSTKNKMQQCIQSLKRLLTICDVCLVSQYKSSNEEFRKLPPKLNVSFPEFKPQKMNRERLSEQFGFFTPLSISLEEQENNLQPSGVELLPADKPVLDFPQTITDIDTDFNYLFNVSCLSDEEIWMRGRDNIIRLYNLKGELLNSVQTETGNIPWDIVVTRTGDLVYTDGNDRSINIVKNIRLHQLVSLLGLRPNTQIQKVICLQGWKPIGVCTTSCGELLVIMDSDGDMQSKVVRYSGATEKQSVQWDDNGQPLYSSSRYNKYLVENRNLDICVADWGAHAVVVVSAAGKLRFRYTSYLSSKTKSFQPLGITADSHGRILASDINNECIHILDQDGNFLRFIKNCDLKYPRGLCVDSRDNLFVAEESTGKVKKIQYYE